MANNQINKVLEFANMQMAAEAFLLEGADQGVIQPDNVIRARLERGNTHTNIFTPTQAQQFTDKFEVITQYRNDPSLPGKTGFSATVYKNRDTNEFTLSIRSTEFIDDAVRDNISNQLEIADLGWAFGQISELESWYKDVLTGLGGPLAGKSFNVTGYSLGAHLATAFNILRREETIATGAINPILATYTFNGAGTGQLQNGRRLTDVITDFNQIRENYLASPQRNALSESDRISFRNRAQLRVTAIQAEYTRVANLVGAKNQAFGNIASPLGDQVNLGYQIAALLVGRDTVGAPASNPPTIGGPIGVGSDLKLAPFAMRFANMTEIVGMETNGLATSFVSNSGIHYGGRVEVPIEAQPLYRGNFPLSTVATSIANGSVKLMVNDPGTNDFADTHSLPLIIDSLSLMAAMEKLAPTITMATAGQIFAAMSNARASELLFTQGKTEGDTLEYMLDALRKLVLGPGLEPTLNEEQMRQVLLGNTWHKVELRRPFHENLKELRDQINTIQGPFTFDSLATTSAAQLETLALNPERIAYRYALKELNPFALTGDAENTVLYSKFNASGELNLYDAALAGGQPRLALPAQAAWFTGRNKELFFKNNDLRQY